jgi:hypothetical protein
MQAELGLDFSQCQRWRQGRERYRPAGEVFDHRHASVEIIDSATAKRFVQDHHYSASFPAARLSVGVFVKRPFEKEFLGGVSVFSVPMSQGVIPARLGVPPNEGVELGRLVLLDELEANAESWFVARAFRKLRSALPEIKGVLAYCDPEPRMDQHGNLVKKGHIGTIYSALNARRGPCSRPRTLLLDPRGAVVSERAIQKLRNSESGMDYVERSLRESGLPQRWIGESGSAYIKRLVDENHLRRLPHPGNFSFTWSFR